MDYLRHTAGIIFFIILFVGSGIYFSYQNVENAFYQLPPIVAILPAIAIGWAFAKPKAQAKEMFFKGLAHPDILLMCAIFLLAGAFSQVTADIGSVKSTVSLAMKMISPHWLVIGIFVVSAFISTAVGTSMGAIVTVAPIVTGLAHEVDYSSALLLGTVVGGAMFGDNLSMVSDTTIAAVMSQEADPKLKFILNAKLAVMAGLLTMLLLYDGHLDVTIDYQAVGNGWLTLPYFILIALALLGLNVFMALTISTLIALVLGYTVSGLSIIELVHSIHAGFLSMQDILLLSLMVGGLSGLMGEQFVMTVGEDIARYAKRRGWGSKGVATVIMGMGAFFDALLANNTIAIILSGRMAKTLAMVNQIPRHISAAWLDIGSCFMQGLIPYGAQILLASSLAHLSPLSVAAHVYYCMLLPVIALLYIILQKK